MLPPSIALLRHPMVVELIGPAGVGKSTLAQLLCARSDPAMSCLAVWGLPRLLLARTGLTLLSVALVHAGLSGLRSSRALRQAIQVDSLLRLLQLQDESPGGTVLLDEGAVFALASLRVRARASI